MESIAINRSLMASLPCFLTVAMEKLALNERCCNQNPDDYEKSSKPYRGMVEHLDENLNPIDPITSVHGTPPWNYLLYTTRLFVVKKKKQSDKALTAHY
ncbi:MAG: hypothetical protein Q8P03_01310 [bacterium]|nr:hypothetical protein [bacterium]